MKVAIRLSLSGRRPGWRTSACALALATSVLLAPAAASAAPAAGPKPVRTAKVVPVQFFIAAVE
jgi:hypothetical protein